MTILRALRCSGAALLFVLPIAGCAAVNAGSPLPAGAPPHLSQDEKFIDRVARDGLTEVRLARLAADRATDPRVKDLAQSMLADFETSNDRLSKVAASLGLSLPQDLDWAERWDYKSLARLHGDDLHRYYVNMVAEYHVKEVRLFRREIGSAADPAVRQFAVATLPVLKAGRETAQKLIPFWGYGRTYGGDTPQ